METPYGRWAGTDANSSRHTTLNSGKGCIFVRTTRSQVLTVYDASGKQVRKVHLKAGISKVGGLAPGIYIAAGKKVVVQ